jgi:dihydroorotate dehydrogenase electron transfer subunit
VDAGKTNRGLFECEFTEKRSLGPEVYEITLAPFEADVRPFQFAMIGVPGRNDLLLKRPFSIFDTIPEKEGGIKVLVKTVGEGTKQLTAAPTGTRVETAGPFGKPSNIPGERIAIVAGGIGIAGTYLFAKQNARRISTAYFGSTTKWAAGFYKSLDKLDTPIEIATDDGTLGHCGLVTDLLTDVDCDAIVACGPPAMLERVYEITARVGIPAYGSFEARMACGVGACRGCAIPVKPEKSGGKEYLMVCENGPVFDMDVIDWEGYRATGI